MKDNTTAPTKMLFPNLLGIRFWMSCTIIYCHVEETKYIRHLFTGFDAVVRYHTIGFYPMLMFFSLSGFLITYQLETEKIKTQTISLRKFYKNRALRILPLYYLSIIIYWLVIPNSFFADYFDTIFFQSGFGDVATYVFSKNVLFLLCLLMMPQIPYVLTSVNNRSWVYGAHHWSVGVEEFFYIFWPILWRRLKNFKRFIIKCFIGYYVLFISSILLVVLVNKFYPTNKLLKFIVLVNGQLVFFSSATCFFIGAIGIYLYIHRPEFVHKYITKVTALICFAFVMFIVSSGFERPLFVNEIVCACFIVVILYLMKDGKKILIFEHPLIVYLGKITYAVYLVHWFVLVMVMYFLEKFHVPEKGELLFNLLQYSLTIIFTYGIAAILYEQYEKRFLALRQRLN